MRVLIAAKHPPGGALPVGGVQSWSSTVGAELESRGHEVAFWGPEWALPEGGFDLGVFANTLHTAPAFPLCERLLVVAHGVIPDEAPAGLPPHAVVAYTSEEVRGKWRGGAHAPVLRQPMDLSFWRPDPAAARRFLTRFSYRGGLSFLPAAAASLGLEFRHLRDASPEECRHVLQRSAVVFATGRAAVEAMACGAPVVVADAREYQEPLYDPDAAGAMARNYSGRGGSVLRNQVQAIAAAKASMRAPDLYGHAVSHHDAAQVVDQLLDLAEGAPCAS